MRRYHERVTLLPEGLAERSTSAAEHVRRRRQPHEPITMDSFVAVGNPDCFTEIGTVYCRSGHSGHGQHLAQPAIHARSPS
jgi:hypothetical protein